MANIVVNSHNVGTDLQSCILQIAGGAAYPVQNLGHLKSINTAGEITPTTITPVIYGGLRLHRNIYHDYSGALMFERYNGALISFWNNILQNAQNTGQETYFSLYATIFNAVVNTYDEYLWSQAVVNLNNGGEFSGTAVVEQGLQFRCQTLTIVGNSP